MPYLIQVILPLPLERTFSYQVNEVEYEFVEPGMRVAVPFGKSKIYTAIIYDKGYRDETDFQTKEIQAIIDEVPLITKHQLEFWKWISQYYMCTLGECMRAALPSNMLLESETVVIKNEEASADIETTDQETLILDALEYRSALKVSDVVSILDRKTVMPVLRGMVDKQLIILQEELSDSYSPKMLKYIQLEDKFQNEENLRVLLDEMSNAPKQRQALMTLFMMQAGNREAIPTLKLQKRAEVTRTVIKSLIDKGVLFEEEKAVDRVISERERGKGAYELTPHQLKAMEEVQTVFENDKPCLLHGVTASGKTEIYVQLINEQLENGKQVLYLLPEIALTTQLIARLKEFFTHKVLVYHSRYSLNERLEVWKHVHSGEPFVVIGARSTVLLPFRDMGLVIVDEEHENTFKQYDPAPRYHARDAAIVLSQIKNANILLGSATPSLESFYNVQVGKYGIVSLTQRFKDIQMPDIELVDLREKFKRKQMKGHFSEDLIVEMNAIFKEGKQVILFQNRRGYSPFLQCGVCGESPQCPNCDVSLTYHKYKKQLRCHYCGFHTIMPSDCPSCGSTDLDTKGFGTEQIESEFQEIFPDRKIARMDLDTTRGKKAYERLITLMDTGEVDCLVGTQMVTKGLDFRNVELVGVMNADAILNFPDFRSHERCFQLLVQVAGRAGRTEKQGRVMIQTYEPDNRLLNQICEYDYQQMARDQLRERYDLNYPPYYRMIRITFKHRDIERTQMAAEWTTDALRNINTRVEILGPEFPAIARIRNKYLMHTYLKLNKKANIGELKKYLARVRKSFSAIKEFSSVRFIVDIDPY